MSNVIENLQPLQAKEHLKKLMLSSQHVRADVIFGSPKLECLGTGICKIVNYTRSEPVRLGNDCKRAPAFLSTNSDGSVLQIFLFREMVCLNVYKNHLRSGVFDLTDSCMLDAALVAEVGLAGNQLVSGKYVIVQKDNCFQINIRVH